MFDLGLDDPFALFAGLLLGALLIWTVGGLLLRTVGAFLTLGGLTSMAAGAGPVMLWMIGAAAFMWLAGHWLFAARHGYVKSTVAELAFARLPGLLQPRGR